MDIKDINQAIQSYRTSPPVNRPPSAMTYAPAVSKDYQYTPAAIVTLSDAAQSWLRYQKASKV